METFYTTEFESPVGRLRVASGDRGVVYLELPQANGRGFRGWLKRFAATANVVEGYAPNRTVVSQVLEYLEGKRVAFDLPLDLRGTPFQLSVFAAIGEIACGESLSYAELAACVERPSAVRAVGAASGANPVPLVVPCHRVIGSHGALGGYAGGAEMKARLLAMEQKGTLF